MERMTERGADGSGWDKKCRYCNAYFQVKCLECGERGAIYNRLADYEDAEEQGRLFTFPLAIGEPVYLVRQNNIRSYIDEGVILDYILDDSAMYFIIDGARAFWGADIRISVDEWGNTMFASRAEAEAKLTEMEAHDG